MKRFRIALLGLVLGVAPATATQECRSAGSIVTVETIVSQVANDGLKYVFVGERHAVGPAKRFVVELVNALVDEGYDVGLYVEGFRTDCAPRDEACNSLARLFNEEAFGALLTESRAPVRPLDPPESDGRAARMAATIANGSEEIRVALVGNSHVVYADNPEAEFRVYGGAVKYPDPGDLVEAFARPEYVTLALAASQGASGYSLRVDGCRADYELVVPLTGAY